MVFLTPIAEEDVTVLTVAVPIPMVNTVAESPVAVTIQEKELASSTKSNAHLLYLETPIVLSPREMSFWLEPATVIGITPLME